MVGGRINWMAVMPGASTFSVTNRTTPTQGPWKDKVVQDRRPSGTGLMDRPRDRAEF